MNEKLAKLHQEQQTWRNQVDFYRDEIRIFQKQLGEIATRNTHQEVMSKVESFQNRFIAQVDWMDRFVHDVKQLETKIEDRMHKNPVAYDHQTMEWDGQERKDYETELKMFQELKDEFRHFLTEHY